MGFFAKMMGRTETKSATSSDSLAELLRYYVPSNAGISVTRQKALECSVALACGRVIAEGIAQIPLKLFREQDDGGKSLAVDHPLYDILAHQPNEWQTAYEFREMLTLHAVFTGNAYAVKNFVRGRIDELIPLDPGMVFPYRNLDGTIIYRATLYDGTQITLDPSEIFHLRGPSWNGYLGLDPVRYGREALGLSIAMETHAAKTFANGASNGGFVKHPKTLSAEVIGRFRDQFASRYTGSENAGKIAVLEEGMDFVASTMDFQKAQFIEGRKFQIEEDCRVFRVFPMMIGYSDKTATFASTESFFSAHVTHTLAPWAVRWEQAIERCLLTDRERKGAAGRLFVRFIFNSLMRGDAASRANYYGSGIKDGWLTRNEARALEDLNPLEGLDEPLQPLNMGFGGENPNTGDGGSENEVTETNDNDADDEGLTDE